MGLEEAPKTVSKISPPAFYPPKHKNLTILSSRTLTQLTKFKLLYHSLLLREELIQFFNL
jgi:hypothetical protein